MRAHSSKTLHNSSLHYKIDLQTFYSGDTLKFTDEISPLVEQYNGLYQKGT